MRKIFRIILLSCLAACGCDDSNESSKICERDCGHGSCFVQVTSEACLCDEGFTTDGEGACTVAKDATVSLVNKPVVNGTTVTFSAKLNDAAGIVKDPKFVVKRNGSELNVAQNGLNITVSDNIGTDHKASYTIGIRSSNGVEVEELYVPVWNEEKEFDWRDAVIYFAFIDRFYNGNTSNDRKNNVALDWMGGDFAGLQRKVEEGYFSNLGVNAIWISSISMNTQKAYGSATAYHSYWPVSTGYTDKTASMFEGYQSNGVSITPIEPHFGTLSELKSLVKACHDRGIRVIVDFAANHVDEDSPVFIKHPEWFNGADVVDRDSIQCKGPHKSGANWDRIPETCWFSENLPDFNYNLPEVRKFVIEHAKWLIRTADIDGFRLDAVKHMPIQFTKDMRTSIEQMFAGSGVMFYMLGETFDGDAEKLKKYIGDDMLHGQFDFPLYFNLRSTIMNGDGKFWDLKDFVDWNDSIFGNALMSSFLGNHDVPRAISHIHHDGLEETDVDPEVTDTWAYRQLRLAWTFILTSPKIPMIYYGDEYGMEGATDPDNRRMMEFDNQLNPEQKQTLELVQKLGKIRHQHSAFSRGKRQNIDAYARAYMYLMRDETETILVGICDADDDQSFTVNEGSKGWIDLLNESNVVTETTNITLNKSRQIIVWKLKN